MGFYERGSKLIVKKVDSSSAGRVGDKTQTM
jgi:hypothetical protein